MSTAEHPVPRPTTITMPQVLGWLAPAVGGALLVMLLSSSGSTQRTDTNTATITQLQKDVEFVKQNYTPSKQTDDLRDDVRELTRQMNAKLETLIAQQNTMMMELSRRSGSK